MFRNTIIIHLFILAEILLAATSLYAQNSQTQRPYNEIRGSRFVPNPNHPGRSFLYDKFLWGEIELTDGTVIENIGLNYNAYRDELVYYNAAVAAQISIDKVSLKRFSINESNGKKRTFLRLFFNGSFKGDCYFELLTKGSVSLLAYRKVDLGPSDTYYSKTGMAYQPAYDYYLYSADKGFSQIKPGRTSLLSKFDKTNQKVVKKLLRKNGISISDESGLINALVVIAENKIPFVF